MDGVCTSADTDAVNLVADLGISKTASTATPSAGGTLTFSLVITNAGPSTATSATFADTLPTGLGTIANVVSATGGGATTGSFNIGTSTLSGTVTLPPAGTITVTFQVSVAGTASGTIANVATVSTPPGTTDTTPGNNTGTATITVGLVADLGISKTASTATPSAGGTLTFSLVITNAGPSTATSATFADTLPTGLGTIANVVSATGGGATTGSFNIGTSTLSGTVTLPPAGTITVTFQVSVAGTASGTIANVATVSTPPGTTDTTPGNNTGTATITVGLVADLGISKTASTATPSAGGTLTFSLVITNAGPSTATSATFADTLPTGLGTIANVVSATGGGATTGSFNIGTSTLSGTVTLPPAGTITVTFQVSVAGTASGTIANVATVSTPPGTTDTTPGNNTGTATITVGLVADLGISKTASTATPSAGGTLTFSLVITNAGPSTATSATFADTLPTGLGTIANVVSATGGGATTGSFNIGTSTLSGTVTLPPAGTITVTFQVSVAGTASGTIANVATVSTPPGTTDTTPGNNTGTATITVGLVADLGISKTASTATPSAGGTLTFSLVITNAGPSTATSATFADTLPTGLGTIANVVSATGGGATTGSFNIGTSTLSGTVTLPPAGTITVTFQVSVAGTASGTIANVATVSTPPGTTDTTPGNNTGTATITVGLVADLGISKTASTATPSAGGTLTFSLVITNAGPSTATSATFADTLPTGLGTIANVVSATGGGATTGSFNIGTSTLSGTVTLPPAGTITVTFQVSVAGTASGTIANVATVSTPPGTTDTTPGNNTGTATITVGLVADLGISKTASTATPSAGGTLTFSLVITNAGPSTATSATFADTLPTGLGTIANVVSATGGGATTGSFNIGTSTLSGTVTLPPAGTITVTFQVSVAGTASGTIANVATVSTPPGTTDTTPGNNTGTATITVGLVADLGISKTASTATPSAGGTLTFSLVITNAGPSTATSATFADTLPTGLGTIANVVSATGGGATTGSFNIGTSTLSGTVTLPPAGTITVTFQVSVAGTASGTIANVATVSTPPGTTDTTPGNNTGTATITVGLVADLGISKTASTATPSAGGTLTFSLVITNAGPSTATSATFADTLPTGLGTIANVVSATGGGATTGSFNIGTSTLSGTVTLPPAGTITVTFQVSVAGTASGTIANVATVSTPPGTTDTTPGNNTGTATITVGLVADLGISKTASTATPSAGGTLTFSLVITNAGPSTATSATFADTLPTGLGTIANVVSATGGGATTGSFNIGTSTLSGTVTLPPAGTITVTFQVSVAGTASGTIANVATVSTPPGTTDTTPGNNTGTATITVGLVADLGISKTASTATPSAGGTLTFSLVITNAGPSTATSATFADTLPTGLGTIANVVSATGGGATTGSFNIGTSTLSGTVTLPPAGTITVTFQVSVAGTASGTIANVATVSTPPGTTDTTPGNNTGTATITVGLVADLGISKTASTATPSAGGTLTFSLVITNAGPSTATSATFADTLPTGLGTIANVVSATGGGATTGSFNIGTSTLSGTVTLPPAGTITVTFQVSVAGTASGTIANVATVSTPPGTTDTTPGNNTGTATITVGLVADLGISKTASTATPSAGGTLTFSLVITNAGPSTATSATFADTLPTGLGTIANVVSATGGGATTGSFNIGTSTLSGTVTLPPAGTITVTFQVSVAGTASGTIANVATVSTPPGTTDTTPGNNTGTATITVGLVADLGISKTASTATPSAGGTLTFSLVITNAGPSTATSATFADTLPTGLGTIANVVSATGGGATTGSFNIGTSTLSGTVTLPPAGTITVTFQVSVAGTASGTIANVATVSTPPGTTDTTPGNNTGTATITVGLVADLGISKTASTATPSAGGTLTFSLVITNAGPSTATSATFADTLPTGLGTIANVVSATGGGATTGSFNIGTSTLSGTVTLPPAGTITVTFQVSVAGTASGTIANVATVSTPPGTTDTTPGNNTGTATITVGLVADLGISKTASTATPSAGGTLTFSLVITNAGPSTATSATFADTLPTGLGTIANVVSATGGGATTGSFNIGTSTLSGTVTLPPAGTITVTFQVSVAGTASGTIANVATVSTPPGTTDTTPGNNTGTATITVGLVADLGISKTASTATPSAGGTLTFSLVITNAGPSTATSATFADTLPTGLGTIANVVSATGGGATTGSFNIGTSTLSGTVTLPPAGTITVTFQVSVAGTASGTIANVATVSTPPGTTDTTPGNNTGTATITVGLVADLGISKTASTATPSAGGTLTFSLVITNAGPSTATSATFADTLPTGLGTIANVVSATGGGATTGSFNIGTSTLSGTVTLPPAGTITVTFQVSVAGTASGTIANVATVSTPPGTTDTTPGNNTGTATITVGLVADLGISKTASTATPSAGGTLTFSLVITNAGPSTATSATFADTLPTGLGTIANVVSATGGGATTGSFNIGTSTLSGTVTLPPAGTITVTFQVSVAGTASGTIANVATVSTPPGTTDTTPGNNTGTATITVGLVADLGISKTASTATPSAGGTLTFSLVITNAGPSTATSATFADTLPTGLGTIANVVSATGGGATTGSFNIGTSTLSGTVTLPPAGTITVTFQVSVAGTASGTIANVATVSTPPGTTDTTPGNNTGTATITVGLVADLGISKTASTATPSAGGTLTFSLVITNAGPSTATSATFADTLPTGLGTIANVVSATGGGATTGSFNIGTSTLSGTVTLPPAGTITVTFQVSVAGTASGTIANVATVSTPPGTTDTTPGNNTGTATITVGLVADLGISKTASTATPSAGGTLTFSLVITNAGPSTATSATFADTLPTGLGTIANVVSATGGGATTGSFNIGTSTLSGTVTLPPAGTITVTFQVSVAGTASGTIANVATVSTPPGTTDTTPGNNTGTATITVGLVADLGISKTASTATPSAGGTLTFSLVITNAGPSTATSATFADTLPTGLGTIANVVSATGGGATTGSFNIGTSTLSGTVTLPPAGTITVTFQVSVAGTASGTIANVATVSTPPGTTDTTPGNNTGTATITVGLVADLGISKTASTATPSAGGTLTFSLVITNAGPSTATSATFADTLPTGLGTIANVVSATGGGATTGSFNIGTSTLSGTVTLPPAGTITVTFQVSVAGTASGTIANVATVSTPPGTTDTTPGNNTGTATITVGLVADLGISKTASTATPSAGGTLTFSLVITNAGPSTATSATFADTLPTGLGTIANVVSATGGGATTGSFNIGTSTLSGTVTLPPAGTITVTFQVSVAGTASGTIANVATVSTPPGTTDTTPGNNTGTATITVGLVADLGISKTASTATPSAGGTLTFSLVITNAGPSTATSATFADTLPTGLGTIANVVSATGGGATTGSFNIGTSTLSGTVTLPPAGTITVTFQVSVAGTASGTIANVATVSTPPGTTDTTPGNNTGTATITVGLVADVTVTKVASAVNATAGQTIGYTVTVVNLGPSVAQNVTATDVLGTGLSLVSASGNNGTVSVAGASVGATTSSLAAGQTLTLVVVAQVAPSVTSGFTLTNAASATSTTPDPTPTNTITKTLTVITSADVTLTKVASVANATPGQTISYTVTLVNLGPSVAQNVTISDILSAGLSRISSSSNNGTPTQVGTSTTVVGSASLAVGQTLTLIVNATVTAATGNITNTAVGTSTTPDPTPTNTVTVPTPVANVADVTVTKVASAVNATAGQTIGYTVTVVNLGPSVAQNVTATDVLGTGLSLVSASGNNGTVSVAGASVGATTSSLAAGQTLTLVVVAQVAPSVTSGFTLTNAASATSTTPDPTPTNTITKTLTVITSADVTLTKVASVANATPGQTISYTVTLVNLGPSVAQNVTISDILSAGLSRISSSSNNGTPTQVGTSTTVVGSASLAVGQTLTLIVNATVTAATGNITNTAVGTSTTPDPTPTNTVTVPTPVANVADVTVTKVASAVNATAGQTIGYTVTVVNLGPSVAQNVTATDVLGTGLSLVSASGNNGTVSVAGASVGATTSSLAAGQTLTLVVVAQVAPSVTSGFTLTNAASATSTTPDPTPTNTITKTLTVITSADVTLTKVASVANATPGQTISYTVTLVNLGPSVAQNVTISDILSAGLSRISSSSNNGTPTQVGTSTTVVGSASLAVGQTLTLIVNATVTAATGNITNTAVGTSTTPDPTPTNTVTVPTPVANVADVTVTKVASAVNATAGQTIGYTVTVVNLGPSVAQNVTATDVLGTGLSLVSASGNNGTVSVAGASVGATTSSLAAGQTLTLVVVAQVAPSVTSGFTLTNAASATSTTPDPTPTNTITKTLTVITSADVTLTKVASVANATPGQTISYTVTLVNLGPSVAQNVTISDILSAGLSRISSSSNNGTPTQVGTSTTVVGSASLAVGQTLTLIVNATVTAATGNITNTAVGTSTTPDPTPTNTVTVPTPVANVADVTVTKVASAVNATAGQTIGYTVTVVNLGPSVAQNVTATDVLGTGLSLVSASGNNGTVSVAGASVGATTSSLAAGQTLTLVVVAQVAPSVTSGFTLTNAASATSTTPDPTPTNTITKTLTVITSADVTLTKVASVANATPGQTISYTVTLVNLGPSVAQNVTISDILSAGLSRISSSSNNGTPTQVGTSTTVVGSASLAVGQTLTLIVNATVTAATGNITNTAVGTSTTPDPTPTNTVTVPTPVANVADVTVTKVASAVNATAGQTIGYTVTVVNLGPSVAQNVTATDVLGTGLSLVSASGNNGTVSVAGASVGATTSSLAAGQTLTLVVVAQVAPSVTSGFTLTNAASATSTTPDPTPTNTITKTLTVITSADVTLTKVASVANATPGQTISYTVTLVNLGPSVAQNVTISDILSAGLSRISSSSNNGTPTQVGTSTTVVGSASLAVGQTLTLIVNATVTAATGNITNTAVGTSTTPDPTPTNTVTVVVPMNAVADVSTTLSVSGQGTPGATVTATVTFTNNGPSPAQNVTATIVLPSGTVTLVPIGTLPAGSNTITVVSYPVPAGTLTTQSWTAGVATTTPESTTANNTVTRVLGPTQADVSVTLSMPTSASPGTVVSGTVVFHNIGPVQADNVTRTLVIQSATLTAVTGATIQSGGKTATFPSVSLPPSSSVVFTFTYAIPQSGGVNATATVATTTPELSTANNIASALTAVGGIADLSVSLVVNPETGRLSSLLVAGENNSLQVVVTNLGTAARGGTATLILPPFFAPSYTYPLRTGNDARCAGGNTCTFVLTGPLSPGQTTGFTVSYYVVPNNPTATFVTDGTAAQTFTAVVRADGPESRLDNNDTGQLLIPIGANLSGTSCIDSQKNGRCNDAGDVVLPNVLVKLFRGNTATLVATRITDSNGRYEFKGLEAGSNYMIMFLSCTDPRNEATCTTVNTTPRNNGQTTVRFGEANRATVQVEPGRTTPSGGTVGAVLQNVVLVAGDSTINQELPLDPSGSFYDSSTRQRIASAITLRLCGPAAFSSIHLVSPAGASVRNVGGQQCVDSDFVGGFYSYLFNGDPGNRPPDGEYTLAILAAPGYQVAVATGGGVSAPGSIGATPLLPFAPVAGRPIPPDGIVFMQQDHPDPITVGGVRYSVPQTRNQIGEYGTVTPANAGSGTQYALRLAFNFSACGGGGAGICFNQLFNNNIPLDAIAAPVVLNADVSMLKSGPVEMVAGGTGTYTLAVGNGGPGSAANVVVTDNLPAGLTLLSATVQPAGALALSVTPSGVSATTNSFAAGAAATLTLVVRAEVSAVGTTVTNVASIASSTTDTNPANNTSSVATRIIGADMSMVKTGPASLAAGGTAVYVLTVINAGPSAAANVTVTDALPAGLTLLSASASSGNFTLMTTSSSLTALALAMPVGTTNIVLTVALDDLLVGTVTNVARVSNTIGDPNPSNNSGTATSAVLGADLSITKLGPPSISAAGTATYTLVIVNNGPSSAGNVTVTDVIPVGLSLLSTVASGATLTVVSTPDKMVANAPLLRAGSTATLVLTVQAAYTATGTVTNIANITSTTPDPTATNNIGSATSSIRDVEPGVILVNKTGNKTVAELGDSVQYTIRMRNTIGLPVNRVTLEDLLPAGFRYILGTARLNGVALADPAGGVGRQLVFDVGNIPPFTTYELTYYVRLGVGSQQGDGVNRATAVFPGARGLAIRSNTALFKVNVQGGVFSNEGCIVGKVFLDCDGNRVQNLNKDGTVELGIPGVRLVMLDGSYVVTDSEGKYSLCGVKPQTHVIKVDRTTLPAGSRLLPSSNRNAGVGDSLFVDMKGGELARADFIEGSCSVEVLEQVKARRAQGGVAVPETRAQPQAGGVK